MKTLVLSDTHLTDEFDQMLCYYIADLVKSVDRVVINGDFWDGYVTTFDAFCKSEWKQLFPLLKEKHAIYIFGNHDKQEMTDDRVKLFSKEQTLKYDFTDGGKHFHIEHGNLIVPEIDDRHPKLILPLAPRAPYLFRFLSGRTLLNKVINWLFIDPRQKKLDRKMVRYVKKNLASTFDTVIFGHSHVFHTKCVGDIFWNSGYIEYTTFFHLIITNGMVAPFSTQFTNEARLV